jgi:transposase
MNSVGIDLHRKRSHVAALDERGGELFSRRIANDPGTFVALLAGLEGESKVALEATYGWEWLADLLEDHGYELHLAHPLRTKAIASARVKTDAVDARTLAHLLRADLLPEAYVAPRELRDQRDLLRQRVVLTQMRSALKNRVHALIARQGIQRAHADLFGAGGRRFLDELPLRADPRVDVLRQIYGIGRYLGMLIVAEIGAIERFPSARHLCAWAGLTPTVRSSDARARLGHISHQGLVALRWALVEAAQKACQGGGPLRQDFDASPNAAAARSPRSPSPANPHPLLLRPARRRDPLPQAAGPGERDESHGAVAMTAAAPLVAPPARHPACASSGELVPMSASHTEDGRRLV